MNFLSFCSFISADLIWISDNFSLKDLKLYSIRDTLSRNFNLQVLYCTWWEPLIWLNCFFSSALTQRLLWERWMGARRQFNFRVTAKINSPLFFMKLTMHFPILTECVRIIKTCSSCTNQSAVRHYDREAYANKGLCLPPRRSSNGARSANSRQTTSRRCGVQKILQKWKQHTQKILTKSRPV